MPLQQIHKIIGPPGTGKTTRILSLIEEATSQYPIEQIGAVSFTNAAVEQMRKRLMETSGASFRDIKNVKTLHSHVFDLLGLKPENIADKKIRQFNEEHPEFRLFSTQMVEEEDQADEQAEVNAKNFRAMQIYRNRLTPEADWPQEVKDLWSVWKRWMDENEYIDFTGMLELLLLIGRAPSIDILFVDEAQDLTRLQLEIIQMWSRNINLTTMVGDSDQAIFRFAGACPEVFKNLAHNDLEILSQSWRVPPAVHRYAMDILSQIRDREEVEYQAFQERGEGEIFATLEPDLSLPGSHMIISRCLFGVKKWQRWIEEQDRIYWNPYKAEDLSWNPTNTSEYKAIQTYLNISGAWKDKVTEEDLKNLIKHIKSSGNLERGIKTEIEKRETTDREVDPWEAQEWGLSGDLLAGKKTLDEVFDLKTKAGKMALRAGKGGKLKEPPVTVGTIHSVKGGEADHVWLDLTKSKRILREERKSDQVFYDELRVAYVGVTRSRETVGILGRGL